jgi:carbon monoxide dehydrogenase subunit G
MLKLNFSLSKNVDSIKKYLLNPELFVEVHPMIWKMQDLGDGKFKVFEKVKLGLLPYSFTYIARITELENKVIITATIMGITKISMDFQFTEHANSTTVEETIAIQSPLPVKSFMHNLFRTQHDILFKAIDAH